MGTSSGRENDWDDGKCQRHCVDNESGGIVSSPLMTLYLHSPFKYSKLKLALALDNHAFTGNGCHKLFDWCLNVFACRQLS
jgi:hypothetical protein